MPTITDAIICSNALANLKAKPISSLSEDSPEARQCNKQYDHVLETVLLKHQWTFANRTIGIGTAISGDDPPHFKYRFTYPSDCVAVRFVGYIDGDVKERVRYDIERTALGNKSIVCDFDDVTLKYTQRVKDPNNWSPLFIEALESLLTSKLAMPLNKDEQAKREYYGFYRAALAEAMKSSREERWDNTPESDPPGITARRAEDIR